MSYRELRNFCEIMRSLGYSRKISVENFRKPNFELIAEILYWLVMRYDPQADISDNIDEEADRVEFIKSVVLLFATKARLKLNPKRLYESSGYAVREILKIAEMLNKALISSSSLDEDDSSNILEFNISSKIYNLKQARLLAAEITESGAKLYEQLGKEKELRISRQRAVQFLEQISTNFDDTTEQDYIEKCIKEIASNQTETVTQMSKMVENLNQDKDNLEQKIKRRTDELERAEKRLKSFETIRPAFMDEYEQLEEELKKIYLLFVEKYRNLDYLQHELDLYNKREEEKKEQSEKAISSIRMKIREEEMRILRGENEIDEAAVDEQVMRGFENIDQLRETKTGFNKAPGSKKVNAENAQGNKNGKEGLTNPLGPSSEEEEEEEESDPDAQLQLEDSGEILDDDGEDEFSDSGVIQDEDEDDPNNDF
jgi:clusterin-associated protein 1